MKKEPPGVKRGGNVRITQRDIDLFHALAKFKYLNTKQIAALFFVKPVCWEWDPAASKAAAATRISRLVPDYLDSAYIPGTHGEKCYYLGPAAIKLLKTDAELEDFRPPRYQERKRVGAIYNTLHDLPMNSLLINLMLLEKLRDDFTLREMLVGGDLSFRVMARRENKYYGYKPDAYVRARRETERACLIEMDTGAVKLDRFRKKVELHWEFTDRRLGHELLGLDYLPVMCVIAPDMKRLKTLARQVRTIKKEVQFGGNWPVFLATVEGLDVRSVENGHVTDKPLRDDCWYDEDGDPFHSPFTKIEKKPGGPYG
ncbi:MAG: replication-relaxation family protein [Chloroflexi bacterium]|nr:replication-relaxation family protein [Chloroflexota bacterium]